MADQMQRALSIAVVQADENAALRNTLFAAEWVIADLRKIGRASCRERVCLYV